MAKTGVETVTRLRAVGAGRHGDKGTPVETDITGCTFIPASTGAELVTGQDTVYADATLVCPPGTDLVATDRVRVRGVVWGIQGDPGDYRTRKGKRKAVIAALEKVTG